MDRPGLSRATVDTEKMVICEQQDTVVGQQAAQARDQAVEHRRIESGNVVEHVDDRDQVEWCFQGRYAVEPAATERHVGAAGSPPASAFDGDLRHVHPEY